ncbi:MAG: tRNA pseudouridine(38-40) synthase TruA [Planctomycetaceae bacterium]|nr:tRNA pseudouridine(38-40) synthase TruA [bacterium]MDB4679361.1 tRNA pseudouridine(38-40) synthase TruA [Planctomycetaceae bacterium]MDC0307859.1 tRNA pseudouridine(38-40) synthase TruA [Planctomycetaceae bacterium]MDG2391286.1 tRNA pseudouridine(38-40) synthase TruA [Planctomycetaceae bacterium]
MPLPTRNIRLTLAYDGSNYVGWQIQPNGVTVQELVQKAISDLTGEEIKLIAAGRTDSGVHALGQVANFQTSSTIPAEKFASALQSRLPEDIIARDSLEVPERFHATYSAVRKCYRYLIHHRDIGLPFLRNYTWRFGNELDLHKMREAAKHIVGTHDFRCFETQYPNKATSVRTVEHLTIECQSMWDVWSAFDFESQQSTVADTDEVLCLEISADGFLYNMVRAITGTLVDVGRGRYQSDDVERMIAEGNRSLAGPTAPAHGLYLVSVDYDMNNLRPKD